MPYELVALVAALALGTRYLFIGEASIRSRVAVGLTLLASLVIWWYYPQWTAVATLFQVGVGIYVLLYLKVARLT